MRISDWSSDVCSSDLLNRTRIDRPAVPKPGTGVPLPDFGDRILRLRRGSDAGGADALVDVAVELPEIGLEAADHLACRLVIGPLVAPGVPRLQDLVRDLRAGLRDHQADRKSTRLNSRH